MFMKGLELTADFSQTQHYNHGVTSSTPQNVCRFNWQMCNGKLDAAGMSKKAVPQNSDQLMLLSLLSELLNPGIPWSFFSLRLTKIKDFGSTDNLVT